MGADAKHQLSLWIVGRTGRFAWFAAFVVATVAVVVAQLGQTRDATIDVQILAINDFHGGLEPAMGGTGRVGAIDAGGVEFLATHLARLKATNPNTFIVSAGDNAGASPLLSALFHDEPSIEALNLLGLQISALGNHDLDEGWWELYRMQRGGCHPVDGCQSGTPYTGTRFEYLAANVTLDPARADPAKVKLAGIQGTAPRPLLPAYTVREIDGVRIGFIGVVTMDVPNVIIPQAIRGLRFRPEPEAANEAARTLRAQGVRTIVVLMHEGGQQGGITSMGEDGRRPASPSEGRFDINGCERMSPALVDLVTRMSDDIDVVVSGHTHSTYNCTIDGKIVTSAASGGRLLTDIDLRVRRSDGDVASKAATNIVVTRDVPKDPAESALLDRYRPIAGKVGNRVVGSITRSLTRQDNESGEFTIGDVVTDALLEAAQRIPAADAEIAIWNPGGIRADLIAQPGAATTPVTYAQIYSVMPFGNQLIVKSVTGDMMIQILEEQFGADRFRIMQVSRGFSYAYDLSRPRGQRIDRQSVRIDGKPLEPARQYRLATSNFLWDSGDGMFTLSKVPSTRSVFVGVDYDILADYFSRHSPVQPGPQNRIHKIR